MLQNHKLNWLICEYLQIFFLNIFQSYFRGEGPPSQQASCKQNGCILFKADFYLTNTNNYFTGSTNATFESQVANAASGEE